MKRSLGAGEWIRRGLGAAVLLGVVAIAFGLDTGFLAQISAANTTSLEQALLDKSGAGRRGATNPPSSLVVGETPASVGGTTPIFLPVEDPMPPLSGAVQWLNSPPLTTEGLRGKVVLIDFWTYSCINCLRALPYVQAWAKKYKDRGLVVIGVHAPEFAFERNIANVEKAVRQLKIDYPVAIDNDYAIWRAFENQYWPAHYFIDAKGRVRHHHFGEGEYEQSEFVIRQLLTEANRSLPDEKTVSVQATGAMAASDADKVDSPETYIGFDRAENFISPGGALQNASRRYDTPTPKLNQWGLTGNWTVAAQNATLDGDQGGIVYRFHARDLHLVLGPPDSGKPVRFRVRIDGAAPGENHGVDVAPDGSGTVTEQRLYQLVRETGAIADHTFEIEFLDPGVQAFAFTFG